MCCQEYTVLKRKGVKHSNLIMLVSCSAVVLAAFLHLCCAQQQQESAENNVTVIPTLLKRNKPKSLPCGTTQEMRAGDEFFIESPEFRKMKYPNSAHCEWIFQADNCNMGINCPDFQLTDFLCFDHLDIVDKNGSMKRYCGDNGPVDTPLSEKASITFTSSAWFPNVGFKCRVVCRESEGQSPFPKQMVNSTPCHCGKADQKVVGGENAEISHFPWQAGLVRKGSSSPFCGGSLINSKYVLTAAHCVQGRTPYNLEIIFNVTDFGDQGGRIMEVRRTVDNILVHKNFTSRLDFDAALVRLSEPLDISGSSGAILPVCLPTDQDIENMKMYVGENATVTGWGLTSEGGDVSSHLQKAQVQVISNEDCAKAYPTITDRMLCAHTPGVDACQGDSGGPLLVAEGESVGEAIPLEHSDSHSRFVQIGIVSWGQGCGLKPGVYVRITELMRWITTNAKDGSYCGNGENIESQKVDQSVSHRG